MCLSFSVFQVEENKQTGICLQGVYYLVRLEEEMERDQVESGIKWTKWKLGTMWSTEPNEVLESDKEVFAGLGIDEELYGGL